MALKFGKTEKVTISMHAKLRTDCPAEDGFATHKDELVVDCAVSMTRTFTFEITLPQRKKDGCGSRGSLEVAQVGASCLV